MSVKKRDGLCPNGCGEPGPHYVPPSFGEAGFYTCTPALPEPLVLKREPTIRGALQIAAAQAQLLQRLVSDRLVQVVEETARFGDEEVPELEELSASLSRLLRVLEDSGATDG